MITRDIPQLSRVALIGQSHGGIADIRWGPTTCRDTIPKCVAHASTHSPRPTGFTVSVGIQIPGPQIAQVVHI